MEIKCYKTPIGFTQHFSLRGRREIAQKSTEVKDKIFYLFPNLTSLGHNLKKIEDMAKICKIPQILMSLAYMLGEISKITFNVTQAK